MTIVTITPILLVLAIIMYTIVFFKTEDLPKINKYSFLILAIVSVIFSIVVGAASAFNELVEEVIHRMGNSLLNYLIGAVYACQGIGAIIYLSNVRKDSEMDSILKKLA